MVNEQWKTVVLAGTGARLEGPFWITFVGSGGGAYLSYEGRELGEFSGGPLYVGVGKSVTAVNAAGAKSYVVVSGYERLGG
jgi:hypothetical protein